jgi:hypothetical protein
VLEVGGGAVIDLFKTDIASQLRQLADEIERDDCQIRHIGWRNINIVGRLRVGV